MMFPNWAKNILFLIVFMISGLVLVIIIDGLLSGTELIPLNLVIEQVIVRVRTPFLTNFLVFVTRVGSPFILSSTSLLIAFILALKGRFYDTAVFVVALIISVIALTVLKNTFQITRPSLEFTGSSLWSFPSGHATVATSFFFLLSYTFFKNISTVAGRILLILLSIVATGLVAFSRLYLGAHWTLDVLAGITLGVLTVSFTVLILNLFFGDRSTLRGRIGR